MKNSSLQSLFTRLLLQAILACTLCVVPACSGEDSDPIISEDPVNPDNPEQAQHNTSLSTYYIYLEAKGGTSEIKIMTNGHWSASSDAPWLALDTHGGYGDSTLKYYWTDNADQKNRTATITVTTDTGKENVMVNQAGTPIDVIPQVVSTRGVLGNLAKEDYGYIEVTFDRPVTVQSWDFDRYFIEFAPIYSEDRKTVRQGFVSASMGLDATGKVSVVNAAGTVSTIDVSFSFYKKKFVPEGTLRFTLLSADQKSWWASQTGPNKLLQLSTEDGHVMQEIDMPFDPNYICYNPYNQKYYVLPWEKVNSLCIVDPQKGIIEETITVELAPRDHPQYPKIYPLELQFTDDGFGILLLHHPSTTGTEWRYLDSADGNKVSLIEAFRDSDYEFHHLYRSYDGQKIWATRYYQSYNPMYSVSRNDIAPKSYHMEGKFRSDEYYAGGNLMELQFNRMNNKALFITAPRCQCVVDIDAQTYSDVTLADGRMTRAEWDYSDNERSLVYMASASSLYFLLLDMDNADYLFYCSHIWWSTPLGIYHFPATEQLVVAVGDGIYFFDAADIKNGTSASKSE